MFKKNNVEDRKNKIFAVGRNEGAKGSSKSSVSNDGPANFDIECFVATACYGRDDYIVDSLRAWRDEIIRKGTEKGKLLFIRAYYSFIGKPGAWLLKKLPFLKPMARKGIKLFIRVNKVPITETTK